MKPTYDELKAESTRWAQVCRVQNRRIDELETQLAKVTAERDEALAELESHKKALLSTQGKGGHPKERTK